MKPPFSKYNSLENEIFRGLCGFALLTMGVYTLHDLFVVSDPLFIALDCILVLLLAIGYLLSRKFGETFNLTLPFTVVIMMLLGVFYFFLGGLKGTLPFYFILFSFSFSILLKGKAWTGMAALFSATLVFLVFMQVMYPEMIKNVYSSDSNTDLIISFFISLSFTIYGTRIAKKHYDEALERIVRQNEELNLRNEEIKKKNKEFRKKREEVEGLNMQLNVLLEEGSERLREQNRQLLEYAFINSHKVRGPLARVLGLVDLIKSTGSEEDRKLFLEKLEESAFELDHMVTEMNKVLQKGSVGTDRSPKKPAPVAVR